MQSRSYGKHVTRKLLTSLLGITTCFTVTAQPAFSDEGPRASSEQTPIGSGTSAPPAPAEKAAVPEVAPGMVVHVDPKTGAILRQPAPGTVPLQLTPQEQSALSTSHQGLVEAPSSLPGGGVRLDLRGRFQSPLIGTIDANGKVNIQHLGEQSENHDHDDKK